MGCALVCSPSVECAGFAVDVVGNRCVFYWREDVEGGGDVVEQEGYELYYSTRCWPSVFVAYHIKMNCCIVWLYVIVWRNM